MTDVLDDLIRTQVSDVSVLDRLYQRLIDQVPLSDVTASFVMEKIRGAIAQPL